MTRRIFIPPVISTITTPEQPLLTNSNTVTVRFNITTATTTWQQIEEDDYPPLEN